MFCDVRSSWRARGGLGCVVVRVTRSRRLRENILADNAAARSLAPLRSEQQQSAQGNTTFVATRSYLDLRPIRHPYAQLADSILASWYAFIPHATISMSEIAAGNGNPF